MLSSPGDWFPEANQLEFTNSTLGFDTRQAGLYCDGWRRSIPQASRYRRFVKEAFAGVMALPEHGHYTPAAAALRSSVRTGRALVLNFTVPCPTHLPQMGCVGVWLGWGECQANGQMLMRYTVESAALGGGAACPWVDGYTSMHPCA
jgi:hypothetical protein